MAAEKHVRIELWNMVGGAMTSFTSQGDIVLTCYAGEFRLESSTETVKLGELDQAVVPVGTAVKIFCHAPGTLQLIRTPPYAPANKDRGP
jgi:hypothetical protein